MHYLVLSWKSELWMGLQNLAVQNKCSVCNIYSRLTNVLHLYKRYKLLKKNFHVFEIFSSFYFICSACRTHLKNYNNGVQWQVFHHLILTKFNKFTLHSWMDRSEVALADVIAINDSVVGSQQIKLCQVLFILCLSGIYTIAWHFRWHVCG